MPNIARAHRVYVRQLWSQDWTLVEQLYADAVSFSCAPELPRAILHYNYGRVIPYGELAWSLRAAQEILDWYVKIEIDQAAGTLDWYGVLKVDQSQLRGDAGAAENTPSGVQQMRAYGLEYLLMQKQVTTSVVGIEDDEEQVIQRAIGFNLGGDAGSSRKLGNMGFVAGGGGFLGTRIFADQLADADLWTPLEIVRYLLAYQSPRDGFDVAQLPMRIDPAYEDQLASLDYWNPLLPAHGRSLKELLDTLLDRRRLMSYRLVVEAQEEGADRILLRPFTFAQEQIDLPTAGRKIRANADQTTWNFDRDPRVKNAVVVRDTQDTYDVVTVRSERAGVIWTMYIEDPPRIIADWDTTIEMAYNAGSPAAADAADDYEKVQLHRTYRGSDKFERCFRYFKIAPDWDGKTIIYDVVYDVSSDANPPPAALFWYPGLRFESYLPLEVDVDYSTVTANPLRVAPDGSPPVLRRPFAFITWRDQNDTEKFMRLDKPRPAEYFAAHPEQTERQWSVRLQPQRNVLGMICDVSGAPQHVIAGEDFEPADSADDADWPTELDWREMRWTAYMLLDDFCNGQYPDPLPPNPLDVERRLTLDVPGKYLDYVIPYTIFDIDDDGQLLSSEGGFVRDDRQELKDLARLTHGWYATERRSLEVTRHTLDVAQAIGTLITTIGSGATLLTINSVVTQLDLDLRRSMSTVRTQYAEFNIGVS